jgi:ribosomal protein L29
MIRRPLSSLKLKQTDVEEMAAKLDGELAKLRNDKAMDQNDNRPMDIKSTPINSDNKTT